MNPYTSGAPLPSPGQKFCFVFFIGALSADLVVSTVGDPITGVE